MASWWSFPKLVFFTLWDRPPSSGLVRPPADDPVGGLPSGGPPPAEPADSPEPEPIGPAVLSPDDSLLMRSLLMTPKLPLTWSRSPVTVLVTLTTPVMLPSLSQLTRQLRWPPPLVIC